MKNQGRKQRRWAFRTLLRVLQESTRGVGSGRVEDWTERNVPSLVLHSDSPRKMTNGNDQKNTEKVERPTDFEALG